MPRRHREESDEKVADLTPMLDVVFIMLIFFIVTATFIKETGVEINRPDTQTAELKRRFHCLWVSPRTVRYGSTRSASIYAMSAP